MSTEVVARFSVGSDLSVLTEFWRSISLSVVLGPEEWDSGAAPYGCRPVEGRALPPAPGSTIALLARGPQLPGEALGPGFLQQLVVVLAPEMGLVQLVHRLPPSLVLSLCSVKPLARLRASGEGPIVALDLRRRDD